MSGDAYGRALGLAHDSGWSHLSHDNGENPSSPGSSSMYGLEKIANATADEMFGARRGGGRGGGSRGRGRATRRAVRPRVRRAFKAGRALGRAQGAGLGGGYDEMLGSWAWQQGLVPGQDWGAEELMEPYEATEGSDMLDAEVDALLAEDDEDGAAEGYEDYYGLYDEFMGADDDEDDDDDEEFGRRGRGGRGRGGRGGRSRSRGRGSSRGRSRGRGRSQQRQQRQQRRQRRRKIAGAIMQQRQQQMLPPPPPPPEEDFFYEEEEEFVPYAEAAPMDPEFHRRESYQISPSAYQDAYGNVAPPPQEGTFTHSLKVGVGLGVGFLGVALGFSLLSRGLR